MNNIGARSVPTYGGFFGEFRRVHRATWERVCVGGTAQIYHTAFEAETMAWRALRDHIFGLVRGEGERASAVRSEAEKMFGVVFRKGKSIPVQRK